MINTFVENFYKDNIEEEYNNFNKRIIFSRKKMLGIRIPKLREFSKKLVQQFSIKEILSLSSEIHENILLKGFSVCLLKEKEQTILAYLDEIFNEVDNWRCCDMIASSLKLKDEESFKVLLMWLKKEKIFKIRFAIVMMKRCYLDDLKIDQILNILSNINTDEYYLNMAVAWTFQEAHIKYNKKVEEILKKDGLNKEIVKMTKQKIRESKREK